MQFLFLLAMLLPEVSLASISGHWVGKGEARDEATWQANCSLMDLVIEQSEKELSFVSHSFQCRSFRFYHDQPIVFSIEKEELLLDKIPVGTISESEAHVKFYTEDGAGFELDFVRAASGNLQFKEFVDTNYGHSLTIEGEFELLNP